MYHSPNKKRIIITPTKNNYNHENNNRRNLLFSLLFRGLIGAATFVPFKGNTAITNNNPLQLRIVTDPNTYTALAYEPPTNNNTMSFKKTASNNNNNSIDPPPPLILFLHGAGKNDKQDIMEELGNLNGEHGKLLPSLIASGTAPKLVLDNFCVLTPYSYGKQSFYQDPRKNILQFLSWASSEAGQQAGCPKFDPTRVILFGFSDGATVAVELLTTQKFAAGVIAAYGFTGTLPDLAIQRLQNIPIWVFHSADDVIFPVSCSDKLVSTLRQKSNQDNNKNNKKQDNIDTFNQQERKQLIRYSRFDQDPEGYGGAVRGHTTGITASKSSELYTWLLENI